MKEGKGREGRRKDGLSDEKQGSGEVKERKMKRQDVKRNKEMSRWEIWQVADSVAIVTLFFFLGRPSTRSRCEVQLAGRVKMKSWFSL